MIHRTIPTWQTRSWQDELSQLITEPEALFTTLKLDLGHLEAAKQAANLFPLRVTQSFLNRMKPGDIADPLLLQVLPLAEEFNQHPDYSADPLEEAESNPVPGLIHKYRSRVLLIGAPQCAINCRYCFRRHFDYQANSPSRAQWLDALSYIRSTQDIDEVILSGGDPLVISDRQLAWLIDELSAIPHLQRLRIHSRLPIVLPSRVTPELVNILTSSRLQPVLVVHCNHPQELDSEVGAAFALLRNQGITLLNQTVLLKGINNVAETLIQLSKELFKLGVLPYYLHLLDKVEGTTHFDQNERDAKGLHMAMLAHLPGYLVPKLVREEAGATSKTPV
ncbi:EF-P beta-lysylation protein EpmB [Teredinibacter waterburyi]|jgi:L-lysine 2,3-aminomutase (EC 5.4.3.2)|uniref:EF-P beta-lysylation protein EpmB n=1 Tax=Teredinibacter waterburyi TaxID=1500538 RepID=UPI00165FF174|nr:EF-P beta-lysylation protein EpmB [Teredinibacter waterburyi]